MECNKHFSSKANYYIHKREKHTYYNCKTILCDFCKKEFSTKSNLNRHCQMAKSCKNKENNYYLEYLFNTN